MRSRRRRRRARIRACRRSTARFLRRASYVRPQLDVHAPALLDRQIRVHRERDVETDRPERRTPPQSHAGPDVDAEAPGERVARVDEHCRAPVFLEVVLVFAAGDGEIFATDDQAVRVRLADLVIVESADRTIAAREKAQVRRQRIEVADTHRADFAAHLDAGFLALRDEPGDPAPRLREVRVRHERLRRESQPEVEHVSLARFETVVEPSTRERAFGEQQPRATELELFFLLSDLEIADEIFESDRARETVPALLGTRGGELE